MSQRQPETPIHHEVGIPKRMSSEKSGCKFNGECVHKKKMYKSVIRFEDGSKKEEMILEPNMLYALAKHVLAYSDFPLIESVQVELISKKPNQ